MSEELVPIFHAKNAQRAAEWYARLGFRIAGGASICARTAPLYLSRTRRPSISTSPRTRETPDLTIAANTDRGRLAQITASIPEEQWETLPCNPAALFGYTELDDQERAAFEQKHPVRVRIIKDTMLCSSDYSAWKAAKEQRKAEQDGEGPADNSAR